MTNAKPRLEGADFTPQAAPRKRSRVVRDKYGVQKAIGLASNNPGRWVTLTLPSRDVAYQQSNWARAKGADLGVEVKARGENIHVRVPGEES